MQVLGSYVKTLQKAITNLFYPSNKYKIIYFARGEEIYCLKWPESYYKFLLTLCDDFGLETLPNTLILSDATQINVTVRNQSMFNQLVPMCANINQEQVEYCYLIKINF